MTRSKRRLSHTKVPRAKRTAPVRRLHRVLFLAALGGTSLLPRVAAQSIEVTGDVTPGTPDSASSWAIAGQLNIGQWAAGSMIVSDGATVTARSGVLGGIGGVGTATITGAGSSWTLSGGSPSQLALGNTGVGTLNVLDGGLVSSAYVGIGQSISGTGSGSILVSGTDSQLTATTLLSVGDGSDGSLTIEAGGAVVSAAAYIGGFDGDSPTAGAGTALVSGAGSTWTIAEQFYIGFHRAASLRIENQATVTSNQSIIGIYGNATPATAEVSDGGVWHSTDFIGVGYATSGELVVESGGLVTTPTVQLGSLAGGVGNLILAGDTENGIGTLETTLIEKGAGSGTVRFDGGRLRASGAGGTNLIAGVSVQIDEGGARIDTNGFDKSIASELTGNGGLTKEGEGTLILLGDQSYLGVTVVEAGGLLSTGHLSSSEVIVEAGAVFGASGLDGDLTIQSGGNLFFDGVTTLDVLGSVNLDPSFGVDNLFGLDESIASGTYSIITSATTDFSTLGLENWGIGNAYTLDDGRYAYFQGESLQLVITSIIPEPASAASLVGAGILGFALIRRRPRHQA